MRTTRKPANLYLETGLKAAAISTAESRYGISLSTLVERLLRKELAMKRGMVGKRA